jgi:hypothetical protein
MDTILRGHRGRRLVRLLPVVLAALALAVVYVMVSNADTPRRGQRTAPPPPAAASRPDESRAADIYYQNQANYDQAYSACQELGIGILARSLGVKATPAAVAAAYSRDELPAFRKSMSDGCRQALLNRPPAHRSPDDVEQAAP